MCGFASEGALLCLPSRCSAVVLAATDSSRAHQQHCVDPVACVPVCAASRYFTFLLLVWLISLLMSTVFRLFAFAAPNEDAAQSMVGPCVGLFLLFGGFLITKEKVHGRKCCPLPRAPRRA